MNNLRQRTSHSFSMIELLRYDLAMSLDLPSEVDSVLYAFASLVELFWCITRVPHQKVTTLQPLLYDVQVPVLDRSNFLAAYQYSTLR